MNKSMVRKAFIIINVSIEPYILFSRACTEYLENANIIAASDA